MRLPEDLLLAGKVVTSLLVDSGLCQRTKLQRDATVVKSQEFMDALSGYPLFLCCVVTGELETLFGRPQNKGFGNVCLVRNTEGSMH